MATNLHLQTPLDSLKSLSNCKKVRAKSAPPQQSWSDARDDLLDTVPWRQIPFRDDRAAFRDMLDNSSSASVATNDSARTSISGSIHEDGSANFRKRRTKTFRSAITPSLPPSRSKRMEGYAFDKQFQIIENGPDGPMQVKSQALIHWDKFLAVNPLPGAKHRLHVHISQHKRRGQKHRDVHALQS